MTSMFVIVGLVLRRYRQFACAACPVAPEDGMGPREMQSIFHWYDNDKKLWDLLGAK